ncbi:MAG: hypothetical protein ACYS8S_02285, partial [Planctomycetota bacterium]
IPVANHSFEDPNGPFDSLPALPYVTDWIELDNDLDNSANTGVFPNSTGIANADANQLAFLGSEQGNAFLQDLIATYRVGKSYKMTVGVCVSAQYPPLDPNALALSFYYDDPVSDPNGYIATASQPPLNLTSTALEDYSVYLPTVQAGDAWAGQPIGIAIRATGPLGGYWDLDNVRVVEYPLVPNFTDDSIVNLADFAMMAIDWLYCDEPATDVTGEGCVNENDLLILMEYWLSNV